jgi:hypothetical protein
MQLMIFPFRQVMMIFPSTTIAYLVMRRKSPQLRMTFTPKQRPMIVAILQCSTVGVKVTLKPKKQGVLTI